MAEFNEIKIFGKKTFSNVLEEIYNNSKNKEAQIKELINSLSPLIKDAGDATIIVPLIKEYLEIAVKNDEHLIKMASIVQRATSSSGTNSNDFTLPDSEKEELLKIAKEMSSSNQGN